jgi:gliding motility-associated-like protein
VRTDCCTDIIRDTVITCNSATGTAGLCIPLSLSNIKKYNIFIDGTKSAQQFSSKTNCGLTITDAGYNFTVIDYVNNVPHLLEEFGIDATTTLTPNINFNTLEDLAAYMNTVDAAGAWYVDGLNIKAGNPAIRYRAGTGLQFFSEDPEAASYTVRYNDKTTYTGSVISLGSGCHSVVVVDTITGCRDSARICVVGCVTKDTLRDTNQVGTTTTRCIPIESGLSEGTTTIINCGHTINSGNTYSVDSLGCIKVTRNTKVGYNLDTICIVKCDTIFGICDTTIAIFSNTPKVDTIRDTNRIETIKVVCVPLEPGFIPLSTTIVNCGHTNNSGNIYSTDTTTGCIKITRSTTVGFGLDTICIVVCNKNGMCDTTIGIFSNLPSCPNIINDTTISCTSPLGGALCIPLSLSNIKKYNIFIDGTKSAQQFSSKTNCGQTITDAGYNFTVIDYVNNVPHLLEEFGIDATTTLTPNINFNTLEDLAVYMNTVDAAGAWYVDGLNIKAGNPAIRYRAGTGLQFFSEDPEAASYTVRYNDKTTYSSSLLSLTTGCHTVTLVDTTTGCVDSARVCVTADCGITRDTIRDTIPVGTTLDTCVKVPSGMNVVVKSCKGDTIGSGNFGKWTINPKTGCLHYVAGPTSGVDSICIKACDTITKVCIETEVIINITPLPRDTIYDTIPLFTSGQTCFNLNLDKNKVISACDGSTIGTTQHYAWVFNPFTGCITYTGKAIGTDEVCIKVCDTITRVCKETSLFVTVLPPSDTLPVKDSILTCKLITPADSNVVIKTCTGATRDTTVLGIWSIDSKGCINYHSGPAIGNDTLCIVKCDTVTNKCDTLPFIITIRPRVDIIRDTNFINTDTTRCMPVENGFGTIASTTILPTSVCGSSHTKNVYTVSDPGNGCVHISRDNTVGFNLDTVCVVICNTAGICDTSKIIVSNIKIPNKDTIRDTLPVRDNIIICDSLSSTKPNVVVTSCDGAIIGTTNLGTWSIDSVGCLHYKAGDTIGVDILCIVKCDTIKHICDTITAIITIIPITDIIRDTNFIGSQTQVCVTPQPGMGPIVSTHIIQDCGAHSSGNIYTEANDGCINIKRDSTVGFNLDTICVVVCDRKAICDTTKVIISNIKKYDDCELPTVITPNGDGINDNFIVPCPAITPISFYVFNRWGIEVYRNDNYGYNLNYFDGTYRGAPLPDGTYYYVIKYTTLDNIVINKAHYLSIHR